MKPISVDPSSTQARFRNPHLPIWASVVTIILLVVLLITLHRNQREKFAEQALALSQFRQARLDLAQGLLHVIGDTAEASPFERDQGISLFDQAVRNVEGGSSPVREPSQSFQQFLVFTKRIREQIQRWDRNSENHIRDVAAFRIAFFEMERYALRTDGETRTRLEELAEDRDFSLGIAATVALMTVMLSYVFTTTRAATVSQRRERELSQLLQAVAKETTDAVFVKDRNGKYLFFNEAASQFVGKPIHDVIGRDDSQLFEPESARFIRERDEEIMRSGHAQTGEEVITVSGVTRVFSATKAPFRDDAGEIAGIIGISRDVTDHNRAVLELRVSEERLRDSQQLAKTGNWTWEPATGSVWWSDELHRIFGVSSTTVPSFAEFLKIVHPDDRAKAEKRVHDALEGSDEFTCDLRIIRPDGMTRWIHSLGRLIRNETRELVRIEGTDQDITDRKLYEESIRESEDRYRQLIDMLPDAFLLVRETRITLCNSACLKLFGASSPGELLEKPLVDLFSKEGAEQVRSQVAQVVVRNEIGAPVDQLITRLNGDTVPVRMIANAFPDRETHSVVILLHSLVEQRKIEAQLRYQELLLREAAELAHVGGWGFDPETMRGEWTRETARIHDVDETDGIQVSDGLNCYRGSDRTRIEDAIDRAIRFGTPFDLELQLHTTLGNKKWIRTICNPLVENGRVVRVRGSFQDITLRRETEDEIRRLNADLEKRVVERTNELATANKELEAFCYSVSHDLRAPLRAIDGFSRILLTDFTADLPEPARDLLHDVRSNAKQMGELIDDLLALSRFGRQAMSIHAIDSNHLVSQVAQELGMDHSPKVRLEIEPLSNCEGDESLLKQVWVNLLSNAIKYSRCQSSARITVGMVPDAHQVFFVKDNGVGFDMRYAHKLFGVFQRLHRAEDYEGTGVGLAIVQRIIHRHGGKVWADSIPGEGATFYFTLNSRG